jgi:hypothetical protein
VWRAGPGLVLDMVARLGWGFFAIAGIYGVHVMLRAEALRRTIFQSPVTYADALRIRLAGDAVEKLTFTGPFLAEPAKGWLLKKRGLPGAEAFAAVATEYLLYTVTSAGLAIAAVSLLLTRDTVPSGVRTAAVIAMAIAIGFLAAFVIASVTGIGLIAPILSRSRIAIGRRRADAAAQAFAPVEAVIITFLHRHPARVAQVLVVETAAQGMLITEVLVAITGLGVGLSATDSLILEGGAKFVATAFALIPGQMGASEGVYALLAGAIGLPAAAGLTLALVRRVRGLLIASAGVVVLAWLDNRRPTNAHLSGKDRAPRSE